MRLSACLGFLPRILHPELAPPMTALITGAAILGAKVAGINEFLLVQWLAPIASEAPVFTGVIRG